MKKRLCALVAFLLAVTTVSGAVKPGDLKVDLNHAAAAARHSRLYSPEALVKMAELFAGTPDGKAAFAKLAANAAKTVNQGDFPRSGNYKEYIFNVNFKTVGLIWFLTGNPEIGEFIRKKALEIARKEPNFWLHIERFPEMAKRGTGSLQTGDMLNRSIPGLDLAAGVFTPGERAEINAAFKAKGLTPCLRYIKAQRDEKLNNWFAVIGSGAFLTAKFVGDDDNAQWLVTQLKRYITVCFEKDGSYGEGPQYFSYPIGVLRGAAAAMTPKQRETVFKTGAISGEYFFYPQAFSAERPWGWRLMLRDGQQHEKVGGQTAWLLACLTGNPYASGYAVARNFKPDVNSWEQNLLMLTADKNAPADLENLPLMRCFNNGENYIRGSWSDGGFLFVMLCGDTKIAYGHDRAARNGFAFAAHDEYLVVAPGHSSYRGKVHSQWDMSTRANNGVTIDGRGQLFHIGGCPTNDRGTPHSFVAASFIGQNADLLIGEAAGCYKAKPRHVTRAAVYVRNPGYLVIFDRIMADNPHRYDAFFHFNNFDGKAEFKAVAPGQWLLTRPKATLKVFAFDAGGAPQTEIAPSIFHARYSYEPGGPSEGKPGSGIELRCFTPKPVKEWQLATVFFPEAAKDQTAFECSGNGSGVTVKLAGRTDRLSFDGNTLSAEINGDVDRATAQPDPRKK